VDADDPRKDPSVASHSYPPQNANRTNSQDYHEDNPERSSPQVSDQHADRFVKLIANTHGRPCGPFWSDNDNNYAFAVGGCKHVVPHGKLSLPRPDRCASHYGQSRQAARTCASLCKCSRATTRTHKTAERASIFSSIACNGSES